MFYCCHSWKLHVSDTERNSLFKFLKTFRKLQRVLDSFEKLRIKIRFIDCRYSEAGQTYFQVCSDRNNKYLGVKHSSSYKQKTKAALVGASHLVWSLRVLYTPHLLVSLRQSTGGHPVVKCLEAVTFLFLKHHPLT